MSHRTNLRGVAIAAILALAFALRAVAYFNESKPFEGAGLAAEQAEIARNIVEHGKWFVVNDAALALVQHRQTQEGQLIDPSRLDLSRADRQPSYRKEVQQMPGVALLLAASWWVTGNETYAVIQWLQILLDTAMVLLIYWIARRLTLSTPISMFSALLYAVWPGAIVTVARPVLDTWATLFTIGCLGAFVWARDRPENLWRLVPLGALAGLGIYFRPFVALLPLILGLLAAPRCDWRRRLIWAALPTGVALVVLSPWTIRNYFEFHRFIPTRTGLGQAVYLGVGRASGDEGAANAVHRDLPSARYGTAAYDDFLLRSAVRQIVDHPRDYLRLILRRVRFLLPCLLAVLVWRRWKTAALMLVGVAMATIVPYLLIGDDTRFYLPAAFAYMILGAMATAVILMQLVRVNRSIWRKNLVALPHDQEIEAGRLHSPE
jgi:4-amino-4-deoxy-L-arabinose transferase-like glycosyltransferase